MNPLAFTLGQDTEQSGVPILTPCPPCAISDAMWNDLAADIAAAHLIPYGASILAQRWYEGYSAVTVYDGRIISHISLAPIVCRGGFAHTWPALLARLGVDPDVLPTTNVYEFTSSWTDPGWRRREISSGMRRPLMERLLQDDALGMAAMIGLASPIPAKLGWQLFPTEVAPFTSSLIFIPCQDFPLQAGEAWRLAPELPLYQGPHIALDDPSQPWSRCVYWWVSNPDKVVELDLNLAALLNGDLACWRSAVVAAYATPGTTHRLSFFG